MTRKSLKKQICYVCDNMVCLHSQKAELAQNNLREFMGKGLCRIWGYYSSDQK
jgi:hypothetical protein